MVSCLGSLVQPCCGEGGALQTDIAVCGEHSQCSGHTGFAPRSRVCAFPVYTAQAPGCSIWSGPCAECGSSFRVLHKNSDSVGPAFCAFPRPSSSGRQELEGRTLPSVVRLLPSTVPAPASVSVPASVGCVHLVSNLGSWPLAVILLADVDHPESQEVFGYKLEACLQFGRGPISGAEFAPFPSPLPPASGGGWASPPPASSSLELLSPFVLRRAGSVFWPVNFLSLSCYPTV